MAAEKTETPPELNDWVAQELSKVLPDISEKHMSPPLPQVGSGEPVADLMSVLGAADTAIVLAEGKPTGVISRQDLLAFLAKAGKQ